MSGLCAFLDHGVRVVALLNALRTTNDLVGFSPGWRTQAVFDVPFAQSNPVEDHCITIVLKRFMARRPYSVWANGWRAVTYKGQHEIWERLD